MERKSARKRKIPGWILILAIQILCVVYFNIIHQTDTISIANSIYHDFDPNGSNKLENRHGLFIPEASHNRTINKLDEIELSVSHTAPHIRPYRRYDEAGLQPIPGTARSHHLPNAIPVNRTIPRHLVEDMAYHISQRINTTSKSIKGKDYLLSHDYSTDHRTLYLYNPHVLPLHNTIGDPGSATSDPDYLSKRDLDALTGGDPTVRYLVTYRTFLGCNCFGILPNRDIMDAGEQISYLALALLDEHLDVINGTDVLIDFNNVPPFGDGNRYFRQFREDCRTFLIRGVFQIICDDQIHRVQIRRTAEKRATRIADPFSGDDVQIPYKLKNIYGDGLKITLLKKTGKIAGGKNFNIFRSPVENTEESIENKKNSYDYYIQTFPIPHRYERLTNINDFRQNIKREKNFKQSPMSSLPPPSFDTADTNVTRLQCDSKDERCNYDNLVDGIDFEEVPFFPEGSDHGTACCVSMSLGGEKQVMVGISHVKLSLRSKFWMLDKYKRFNHFLNDQFLSRFVAYDVKPPFDIVAISGFFCLGFANEDEGRSEINGSPFAGRNTQYRLGIFNDTFDCPSIHFPSAFSEVVGDQSKAIIGYGINDCYPRIMIVNKKDIEKRLLGTI